VHLGGMRAAWLATVALGMLGAAWLLAREVRAAQPQPA
jgi:hypothetical protein